MTERLKKRIILMLFVASLGLIGWSFYQYKLSEEVLTRLEQSADIEHAQRPFPTEILWQSDTVSFIDDVPDKDDADILAIFVLTPKVCAPCLGEVFDFVRAIKEHADLDLRVQPLVLVVGDEPGTAERVLRLTDFGIPSAYSYDKTVVHHLGWFGDDSIILQQLVFVDARRDVAFYRSILPGGGSPLERKRNIIAEVFGAQAAQLGEYDVLGKINLGRSLDAHTTTP